MCLFFKFELIIIIAAHKEWLVDNYIIVVTQDATKLQQCFPFTGEHDSLSLRR